MSTRGADEAQKDLFQPSHTARHFGSLCPASPLSALTSAVYLDPTPPCRPAPFPQASPA